MATDEPFSVTVSRINEGEHEAPYETITAQSDTLSANGDLLIAGNGRSRRYSADAWDEFEVKRIRRLPLVQ